jgi:hypothetical protein
MGHAILERVLLFGTRSADYIRASGHAGVLQSFVLAQLSGDILKLIAEHLHGPQ